MNAIQFIKWHGVDKARGVVDGAPDGTTHIRDSYGYVAYLKDGVRKERYHENTWLITLIWQPDYLLSDLKRLVESVDLIKKHGGLFSTKCQLDKGGSHYEWYGENGDYGLTDLEDLEQAIEDYEAIGGEHV